MALRVERSFGSSGYILLASVGDNTMIFSDTSVSAGVTYTYRIKAFNGAGESTPSNEASVTPPQPKGKDTKEGKEKEKEKETKEFKDKDGKEKEKERKEVKEKDKESDGKDFRKEVRQQGEGFHGVFLPAFRRRSALVR